MSYPYGKQGESDVKECALTGVSIRPGDVAVHVTGTNLFFRVSSRAFHLLTPEKRDEIEEAIKTEAGVSAKRPSQKATIGGEKPEAGGN